MRKFLTVLVVVVFFALPLFLPARNLDCLHGGPGVFNPYFVMCH